MIDHAVKTRRLTINAAFMKDIKDDNHQLKSLLDQITPLTAHYQTAINHWPELIQLIDALRDQLALHFALEEAYGYFDDAIGTEPQLSAIAECLRTEHGKLFESVRHISDRTREISGDKEEEVTRLLNRLSTFRKSLEKHEEAELDLILKALDDDIGVGD